MSAATSDISTAGGSTSRKASRSAPSAASRTDAAVGPARPVIRRNTENAQALLSHIDAQSPDIDEITLNSAESGFEPAAGAEKVDLTGGSSTNSRVPSGRWKTPHNVMELIAQANTLATGVLNGEVPLVVARTYASVGRTVAALVKSEIERRRYLDAPALDFPNEEVIE